MTWKQFCKIAEAANKNWVTIKDSVAVEYSLPEHVNFLKKSYLVVCSGVKVQLKLNQEYPYINFTELKGNEGLLADSQMQSNSKLLNHEELNIADNIQIEVRFPAVNIDIIQTVKAHPLVDSSKTCMCKASIRVVL